jgi:hypothetical protein
VETLPLGVSSSPLRIGSDVSWAFSLNGRLDELRLWNVARTKDQIRSPITLTIANVTPGLVSVWALDGAGNDLVGGQNATPIGVFSFQFSPGSVPCHEGPTTLCLGGGRFSVTVLWHDFAGNSGFGTVGSCGTSDSGFFWFLTPQRGDVDESLERVPLE